MDWIKIVEFHKQIVLRAQDQFYRLKENDYRRYSILEGFNFKDFSGPWTVNQAHINNDYFIRNSNHLTEQSSWVLGLHAFKYYGDWCPIFVKEISVTIDEELNWIFQPIQANWDVSPQFIKIIGNVSNMDLNEFNDNINKLIERVYNRFSSDNSSQLIDLLIEDLTFEYPDIKESIGESFINFVLFNTPDQAGKFDKNLMKDYENLLGLLKKDPDNIGGFSLIESFRTDYQYDKDLSIEPVIPLNTSQETAVRGILLNNPITVISGPPGCGKSQVVVSTLFNSWIENKSVLFASQNNKAVEVVKERIENINIPIPILARAGARQFSNVNNLPRLITNALANINKATKDKSLKTIDKNIFDIKIKREQLQNYINSKVPIKLEETYRAALSSYYKSIQISNEINDNLEDFQKSLQENKIHCNIADLEPTVIIPLEKWLGSAKGYFEKSQKNAEHIMFLNNEIDQNYKRFNDSTSDLLHGQEILIEEISENVYKESKNTFEIFKRDWETLHSKYIVFNESNEKIITKSNKAKILMQFNNLRELQDIVQNIISSYGNEFDEYISFRKDYRDHQDKLKEQIIDKDIEIDPLIINEWIMLYIKYGDDLNKVIIPFTKKYKDKKRILLIEEQIKANLPQRFLIEKGNMRENRSVFAEVLINIQDYYDFKSKNQFYFSSIYEFEAKLNQARIKMKIMELEIEEKYFSSLKGLVNLLNYLNSLIEENTVVLELFELKDKQIISEIFLEKYLDNMNTVLKDDRIGKAIYNKKLSFLVESIDNLKYEKTSDNLLDLNNQLNSNKITASFSEWETIVQIAENIRSKQIDIDKIESYEELLFKWLSERPVKLSTINDIENFDTRNLSEQDILKKLRAIQEQYTSFENNDLPLLVMKAEEEYKFATDKMNEILQNFSSEVLNNDLVNIIKIISNEKAGYIWPTQQIEELIKNKDVLKIQANIENCDRKIQELVKDKGSIIWKKRIQDYNTILSRFDRLINSFGKNSLDEEDFKNALKLMPIWITTAQSTRGIPLSPNLFDTLIIDEASQCTLTNLLPLIYRAKSIVVIGDLEQLPAIPNIGESTEISLAEKFSLTEEELYNYGHSKNDVFRTILNFLPGGYSNVFNLIEHYRSIPQIIVFSNRHIYNQRLTLRRNISDEIFTTDSLAFGVHKYHVDGMVNRGKGNKSWLNQREAEKTIEVIDILINHHNISNKKIGVVTPFTAQVDFIENLMSRNEKYSDITVGTAHKFQGDERDIMILSTVLSPNMRQSTMDWIQMPHNLINVAITRARNSLILIGDFVTMKKQVGILKDLSEYIDDIELTKKTSAAEYKFLTYLGMQGIKPAVHAYVSDIEVDFIIKENGIRLSIEIDGKQHQKQKVMDTSRDVLLLSLGYKVLRISARDVLETPNVVIDKIMNILNEKV